MYTNDISLLKLNSKSWLFADDTTIALDGINMNEILAKLQEDLTKIIEWLNNNRLLLNLKKSQIMHLPSTTHQKKLLHLPSTCKAHCNKDQETKKTMKDANDKNIKCRKPIDSIIFNGKKVFFVEHVKILGVTLDNQLKYDQHINQVCKKVNSKTAMLKKSNSLFPHKFKTLLFKLLLMPHYDYCSSLFMKPTSQQNRERIINNFNKSVLRFLKINLYGLTTEQQLIKLRNLKLKMLPIILRLFTHFCLFFYSFSRIENIELSKRLIINQRAHRSLYSFPAHNGTDHYKNSFLYISCHIFNYLNDKNNRLRDETKKFINNKSKLKEYLDKNIIEIFFDTKQYHTFNHTIP